MVVKDSLIHNFSCIPGYHTNRHIIIIESDDWGSIRMPSKAIREDLRAKGLKMENCPFSSYDSLASADDLCSLFDVLSSVKDINGNNAVITANAVVANPDFERIKASGCQEYYWEPFTETLKRYPQSHLNSFALWKEGMASKVFIPQLHGREHLNVIRWMQALKDKDEITTLAFEQGHFGLSKLVTDKLKVRYMDAFGNATESSVDVENKIIEEATDLFERMFGFKSKSFIAPCYIWRKSVEESLSRCGVEYLQGLSLQQIPVKENPLEVKTKYHYMGQKNRFVQVYLTRNCFFEPYKKNDTDLWVKECLNRIKVAYRWGKPAIISAHRINFIGTIDIAFRDRNLFLFKQLLTEIIKNWPDVEFMSSDQLGDFIKYGK